MIPWVQELNEMDGSTGHRTLAVRSTTGALAEGIYAFANEI